MLLNPNQITLLPGPVWFSRIMLKAQVPLAAMLLTWGLNGGRKNGQMIWSRPTWPLWPGEVAQSSHPCLASYNGQCYFPFSVLSFAISSCRREKRPSMESCQGSSAPELELREFMPKKSNIELEHLKWNKVAFFLAFLLPPLSLCPKPLADVVRF